MSPFCENAKLSEPSVDVILASFSGADAHDLSKTNGRFREEPRFSLCLVDPDLDEARRGDVVVLCADFIGATEGHRVSCWRRNSLVRPLASAAAVAL